MASATFRPGGNYVAPAEEHAFDGLLFDNDGTIIDSTQAIEDHWRALGKELGVDGEQILADSHGVRSIETIAKYKSGPITQEYVSEIEGKIPILYGEGAKEVPGSRAILEQVDNANVPWAIVTSATRALLEGWLKVMGLAHPRHLVVAEDVDKGKPDPSCYILGRDRLGLGPEAKMLVFEDSKSGVLAGKAAGFQVLALETTHSYKVLKEAGADWIVHDMRSVKLKRWDSATKKAYVEISNAHVGKASVP